MKKIELECTFCKSKIYRTKQQVTKSKIKGYKNNFCNNKCQAEYKKSEKIKNFKENPFIKCGLCKEEKHFLNFNKNKSQTNGYQTICKECNRERSRKYYKDNPEVHKENVIKRNKIISEKLNDFIIKHLLNNPCVDCGEKDIRTLQFDHISPIEKKYNISDMVQNHVSESKIVEEIKKCEVRCANCHAKRTAIQFNWYKQFYLDNIENMETKLT